MKSNHNKLIQVFEYDILVVDQLYNEVIFTKDYFNAFNSYYGIKGVPYFSLFRNGVRFNQFVGVIQINGLTIEVLPQAERESSSSQISTLHNFLINMLKRVRLFTTSSTGISSLKLKANSILDLYFELFVQEVEQLFHKGLVKKYHKTEQNIPTLKGKLLFAKHIQKNLVHQERFYSEFITYDRDHPLNRVLYKTLLLLRQLNTHSDLTGRINSLLLDFPELPDISVSENFFDRIVYNRKTENYRTSIEIAKLLLLNYHPDIQSGRNSVLALMFDMNRLWEKYIYVMLRKVSSDFGSDVFSQRKMEFWNGQYIKPDIVIQKDDVNYILDTKWKLVNNSRPDDADLKQMYVYNIYWNSEKAILLYPTNNDSTSNETDFKEYKTSGKEGKNSCKVGFVNVLDENKLDMNIGLNIFKKLGIDKAGAVQ